MTSLVMQLVEQNIKGKNTLIVVTLPMTGKCGYRRTRR
jgi:hypothetical protein